MILSCNWSLQIALQRDASQHAILVSIICLSYQYFIQLAVACQQKNKNSFLNFTFTMRTLHLRLFLYALSQIENKRQESMRASITTKTNGVRLPPTFQTIEIAFQIYNDNTLWWPGCEKSINSKTGKIVSTGANIVYKYCTDNNNHYYESLESYVTLFGYYTAKKLLKAIQSTNIYSVLKIPNGVRGCKLCSFPLLLVFLASSCLRIYSLKMSSPTINITWTWLHGLDHQGGVELLLDQPRPHLQGNCQTPNVENSIKHWPLATNLKRAECSLSLRNSFVWSPTILIHTLASLEIFITSPFTCISFERNREQRFRCTCTTAWTWNHSR